jgi:hypothetical protein
MSNKMKEGNYDLVKMYSNYDQSEKLEIFPEYYLSKSELI